MIPLCFFCVILDKKPLIPLCCLWCYSGGFQLCPITCSTGRYISSKIWHWLENRFSFERKVWIGVKENMESYIKVISWSLCIVANKVQPLIEIQHSYYFLPDYIISTDARSWIRFQNSQREINLKISQRNTFAVQFCTECVGNAMRKGFERCWG